MLLKTFCKFENSKEGLGNKAIQLNADFLGGFIVDIYRKLPVCEHVSLFPSTANLEYPSAAVVTRSELCFVGFSRAKLFVAIN